MSEDLNDPEDILFLQLTKAESACVVAGLTILLLAPSGARQIMSLEGLEDDLSAARPLMKKIEQALEVQKGV